MAVRREPTATSVPPELVEFVVDDWAPGDWVEAFRLWRVGRRSWVLSHPGSALGSRADLLEEERWVKTNRWRASGDTPNAS